MTESEGSQDSRLSEIGTHSGKLYWLNPPSGKSVDLDALQSELSGKTFQEDISDQFDSEDIKIPGVFEKDGKTVKTTTTENVQLISYEGEEVVVGDIVLDSVNTISYRDESILVLDTTTAKFIVFRESGYHYFSVLGKREISEGVISTLRDEFEEFGSIINTTGLGGQAITNIRESLDAILMDTIITDYDQNEITKTRIRGENYEDTDVYQRMGGDGKVKSHMFQSDQLIEDDTKTISVGRDGLIRVYSNATIQTYLDLLKSHVVPEIHRDVESSPSVSAWGSVSSEGQSIFKDQ